MKKINDGLSPGRLRGPMIAFGSASVDVAKHPDHGLELWIAFESRTAITTRLTIDQLRSARTQRETYIGPWLPEPLLTSKQPDVAEAAATSDTLSMAFLVVLETLSPVERAVFLLREVFAYDYDDIARIVDKTEANCRQLLARARRHVNAGRRRFAVDSAQRAALAPGSSTPPSAARWARWSNCSPVTWRSTAAALAGA